MKSLVLVVLSTVRLIEGFITPNAVPTPSLYRQRHSYSYRCLHSSRRASRLLADPAANGEEYVASTKPTATSSLPLSIARQHVVAVLVCPAQFCVPADYADFLRDLVLVSSKEDADNTSNHRHNNNYNENDSVVVGAATVADLPRTEWIKVARQLPTSAFWTGNLPVVETLKWYFDAVDQGIARLLNQLQSNQCHVPIHDVRLCMVGHSMGGWVARAYLGSMSQSSTAVHQWAIRHCSSFITLGTPHQAPSAAWMDQTRGLIAAIDATPSCQASALVERGIDVTCVCSDALRPAGARRVGDGDIGNDKKDSGRSPKVNLIENMVALASYLPLVGKWDTSTQGGGIVPMEFAFLDAPARRVTVSTCALTRNAIRHCHVLPTPWNLWNGYAPSIRLESDAFCSYVSPGVVKQWNQYIR